MAKFCDDYFFTQFLDAVAACNSQHACSAQPANYAGIAAVDLADVVMAPGDYTQANGDTSGRKVTMAAKADVTIDANGTANHVTLGDSVNSVIYVTTCTDQALNTPGTVSFPAWDIEILDPA